MILLVSVIIPVYNCKMSIRNTVVSILQSGLSEFEIVIIEDGSTDGTSEICSDLESEYENIRCIHQKNSGVSAARNRGIEVSRGEYVLFFDADDTVDKDSLKNAVEIIQKTLPDMLIFGLSFDYYLHGKMYRRDELVYGKEGLMEKSQWSLEFLQLYECNALSPVWNKFIRKSLLLDNQIRFRKDLIEMEDFLFVVQCMGFCNNIYMLPEVIYRYRQAENERSTFNRLLRIQSLSTYMQPFEKGMQEFINRNSFTDERITHINDVVNQIYASLFFEQIHFGDIKEIEKAANDMLSGKYADTIKNANKKLYQLLIEKKYYQVWLCEAKIRIRHWLAVRIKYYWRFR